MKKTTLSLTLFFTLLTPATAGFSFIGDMIKDMNNAAQEIKDNAIDVVKDTKDEVIDAKSTITDDMKDMKNDLKDVKNDLSTTSTIDANISKETNSTEK